ncbi:hypothetical protein R2217_000778 [Cronobacter turicensis]|nr:hypothetical protein [Cronobacter turicensis]ELQ6074668.1 hypothetical protein [Cronobacter turicensis]ELQ6183746.1 hypothetical protein [Cronobacter turicensis]ELQ6234692.1 hypothetical protein [Cronobacter turicensis]ELQ6238572.1 hypothetical protein [Cronobacter turicensis]
MTVVITILADDNARNRRRARRALAREIAAKDTAPRLNRIEKAIKMTEQYGLQLQKAISYHEPIARRREEKLYRDHLKVRNPLGNQINARQKMRDKSIPLI